MARRQHTGILISLPNEYDGIHFHRNQQYSVVALTDSTGTIKERYAYSAYGGLSIFDGSGTARTVTAEGNRYTYTGREWDEELELYHYRARMYDPLSGRFLSRDPIGYVDGASLYRAYFIPYSIDPLGLLEVVTRGRDSHIRVPWASKVIAPFEERVLGRTRYDFEIRCRCNASDEVECELNLDFFIQMDPIMILYGTLYRMRRSEEDLRIWTVYRRYLEYMGWTYGHEQLHAQNFISFRNRMERRLRNTDASAPCMPCDAYASMIEQRAWDYWEHHRHVASEHEYPTKEKPRPSKGGKYPPQGPIPHPTAKTPEPFDRPPRSRPRPRTPVPQEAKVDDDPSWLDDWLEREGL